MEHLSDGPPGGVLLRIDDSRGGASGCLGPLGKRDPDRAGDRHQPDSHRRGEYRRPDRKSTRLNSTLFPYTALFRFTTRAAGQVVAWGPLVNAIPTVPATATNLIAIGAGNIAAQIGRAHV